MENPNEIYNHTKDRIYRTFAEMFLEEPTSPENILGAERVIYMSPTITVPIPTFCTWRGIPTIDDCDWLE